MAIPFPESTVDQWRAAFNGSLQDTCEIRLYEGTVSGRGTVVRSNDYSVIATVKCRGNQASPVREAIYRERLRNRALYTYYLPDQKEDGTRLIIPTTNVVLHVTRATDGAVLDLEVLAVAGQGATLQFSITLDCALENVA